MSNVDSWCKACGEVELPSELQDLEDAIHHHQGIYEHITLAYSEVGNFIFSVLRELCATLLIEVNVASRIAHIHLKGIM